MRAPFLSKQTIGTTLLISGCCIGAGMVGLPVVSALAGFMPATVAMLLCYLFTTVTGLLLLEATLWFDKRVNLMSITEFALGTIGKILTLLLFLFLFYCLFVAYIDAGGQLFSQILAALLHHPVSRATGIFTCVLMVGACTYAGTKIVVSLNHALLIGLALSYTMLIMIGLPKVSTANLTHINWNASIATIPILLICFGYQNLVPSLAYYLKKDIKAIQFAIIVGNFIPFLIYMLWNAVILGMINPALLQNMLSANLVTDLLLNSQHSLYVLFFVNAFSFFAILTSFIPNAISFIDFLKDGFKILAQDSNEKDFFFHALVFIPPLLCSLIYPDLFLQALSFAGGFIDVLLFGILPATVVLIGRHKKKIAGPYRVAGKSFTPIVIIVLSVVILLIKLI